MTDIWIITVPEVRELETSIVTETEADGTVPVIAIRQTNSLVISRTMTFCIHVLKRAKY